MIGVVEQRLVVRRIAVRPELGVVQPAFGEERADASRLLRAAAVRPVEPSGEEAVGAAAESRADDIVDTEELRQRQEVGIEGGRGERDGVTQLADGGGAAPSCRRGGATPPPRRRTRLRDDRSRSPAGRRARRRRAPSARRGHGGRARCQSDRTAEQRRRQPGAGGPPKEGEDAVSGRQRAVHVEHRGGRARGEARFGHGRTRLYTRDVSDGPEIFDDLYLGLQAGGALRKQRRGEELTAAGARGDRPLAADGGVAQGRCDRRLRGRHVRARIHHRRPHLRPLAQGVGGRARPQPLDERTFGR